MSLLTICQTVARETGYFSPPASVINNTNEEAQLLRSLANRSGKRLAKRHNWEGLTNRASITTAASDDDYSLPDDFDRFVADTWWDDTNNRRMKIANAQDWEYLKNAITADPAIHTWWRRFGGLIYLHPVPDAVETLRYEYVSNAWVVSGGSNYTAYQTDDDTTLLSEELIELDMIWRVRKHYGGVYLEDRDEAERAFREHVADDVASEMITTERPIPFPIGPDGGFGL